MRVSATLDIFSYTQLLEPLIDNHVPHHRKHARSPVLLPVSFPDFQTARKCAAALGFPGSSNHRGDVTGERAQSVNHPAGWTKPRILHFFFTDCVADFDPDFAEQPVPAYRKPGHRGVSHQWPGGPDRVVLRSRAPARQNRPPPSPAPRKS